MAQDVECGLPVRPCSILAITRTAAGPFVFDVWSLNWRSNLRTKKIPGPAIAMDERKPAPTLSKSILSTIFSHVRSEDEENGAYKSMLHQIFLGHRCFGDSF